MNGTLECSNTREKNSAKCLQISFLSFFFFFISLQIRTDITFILGKLLYTSSKSRIYSMDRNICLISMKNGCLCFFIFYISVQI